MGLVALVPLIYLAVFFGYPVGRLVVRGLAGDIGRLAEVVTGGRFLRILWFTTWQAAASTGLAVLIALPLTWAVANRRFVGRRLVRVLVTVPFVLPSVVVAGAWIAVMDRLGLNDGTLRLRHTVWAVLLAHAFFNVAVVVRTVGGYWSQLDRRPEEAARTLGASPWQVFREVTFPRLRGAIGAATSIVYLFCFTSFAIVLLLGGPRRSTLETEIYRWAVTRTDIATAAALSVVQMVAVAGLVAINLRLQGRDGIRQRLVADRAQRAIGWPGRAGVAVAVAATCGFLAMPLAMLVERSVRTDTGWSLDHYRSLADRVRLLPISAAEALANSVQFALAAAALATVVGALASIAIVHGPRWSRRLLDVALILPLGTSAVTLGFGVLIALDRGVLDLRSSWWIVPITQSLIAVPFVIRSVVPVLRSIDDRLRQAAATLGASPSRVRREIDVAIGSRALATGIGFAFAISLGEFGATSFVGRRGDLLTVPLAIERLLATPGTVLRGQAMALAVILMAITTLIVLVGDRLHPDGGGVL